MEVGQLEEHDQLVSGCYSLSALFELSQYDQERTHAGVEV